MPSFDIVSEAKKVEIRNAVNQTNKETSTRFDFKGSNAYVDLTDDNLTAYAESEFQINQVYDVLASKFAKRNVDIRFFDIGVIEKIGGGKVKRLIKIKTGIESEMAKKISSVLKNSKVKIQTSIQGDTVRVASAKRDALQEAMAILRKEITTIPLEFNNFRD